MAPRLLFARDVIAFSDEELDRYLDQSLEENGIRIVDVEDPENLPTSFVQRLREKALAEQRAQSKAVDLGQVSNRLSDLLELEIKNPTRAPKSPASIVSMTSEEYYEEALQEETKEYNWLIENGGHPSYPIDLLPDVGRKPEAYPHLLRYWVSGPRAWAGVFHHQAWRWDEFRKLQERVRRESDDHLMRYTQEARDRLAAHSVHRPLQFDLDYMRQDRLTTWLEFLNAECMSSEHFERTRRRDLLPDIAGQIRWIIDQLPEMEKEVESTTNAAKVSKRKISQLEVAALEAPDPPGMSRAKRLRMKGPADEAKTTIASDETSLPTSATSRSRTSKRSRQVAKASGPRREVSLVIEDAEIATNKLITLRRSQRLIDRAKRENTSKPTQLLTVAMDTRSRQGRKALTQAQGHGKQGQRDSKCRKECEGQKAKAVDRESLQHNEIQACDKQH